MPHLSAQALVPMALLLVSPMPPASSESVGHLPRGLGAENIPIEFTTENGWVYDGRIELPAAESRNGYAVMMLGGGIGSPIDWAVPGVMTLDGKPTRDGDTIAQALLEAGFIVMRWQSIRRGDNKYAEDAVMMDPPPYPQTIEQAKRAYAAFREKKVVPDDRIFLLGHSLGARRAAILVEENPKTPGVVMLAGASFLPSDLEAAKAILTVDTASERISTASGSERAGTAEDVNSQQMSPQEQDGAASATNSTIAPKKGGDRHEDLVRVFDAKIEEWIKPFPATGDKYGYRWPADVLAELRTPIFLPVGSVDDRWLLESYMFTVCMRRAQHPDYTWKVYEGLGHQLGPELAGPVEYKDQGVISGSRTGPIDPRVVKDLVDWLKARAKEGRR